MGQCKHCNKEGKFDGYCGEHICGFGYELATIGSICVKSSYDGKPCSSHKCIYTDCIYPRKYGGSYCYKHDKE